MRTIAIATLAFVGQFAHCQTWVSYCNPDWAHTAIGSAVDVRSAATPVGHFDTITLVNSQATRDYRRDVLGVDEGEPALLWRRSLNTDWLLVPDGTTGDERGWISIDSNTAITFHYNRDDNNFWPKTNIADEGAAEDLVYYTTDPVSYRIGLHEGTVQFHVAATSRTVSWWAWPGFPHHMEFRRGRVAIEFWTEDKDNRAYTGWHHRFRLGRMPSAYYDCLFTDGAPTSDEEDDA